MEWANQKLTEHGSEHLFVNLTNDVRNGVKLARLAAALTGGCAFEPPLPPRFPFFLFSSAALGVGFNDSPTSLWQYMQNATTILRIIEEFTLTPVAVASERDIVMGNLSALSLLGVVEYLS